MSASAGPRSDTFDIARCALLSALRRRGLAPWEEPTDASVTVEFGYRRATVHSPMTVGSNTRPTAPARPW